MSSDIKPYTRAPQVIRALYRLGPLNRRALEDLIHPRMSKRQMNFCLQRLKERGLVINCNKISGSFAEHYYQLSYCQPSLLQASQILGIGAEALRVPSFRAHDVEHSVICAYWSDYFQQKYPQALVVRDFHLAGHQELLDKLVTGTDMEVLPDIVIHMKAPGRTHMVTIAVEVERSLKSRGRIFRKLRKFAARSYLDGAIYLCPTPTLSEAVADVYVDHIRHTARRIRQYGEHFLMFSGIATPGSGEPLPLLTPTGTAIELSHWMNALLLTPWHQRSDLLFEDRTPLGATSI